MPREEAEALLRRAQLDAEKLRHKILQQAHQEADFLREKAREEGFMAGYEEGQETAAQERQAYIEQTRTVLQQQLTALVEERRQYWQELLNGLTDRVGEMALVCCEKMVGMVPEGTLPYESIRRALEALDDGNKIQIRVHPKDQTSWPKHLPLEIILDETVSPGEFFLRGAGGTVDGSWANRWATLKSVLLEQ